MRRPRIQQAVAVIRKVIYAGRSETFEIRGRSLRFVPGTRPVRMKYRDDPDLIVRNDVRQMEYFAERVKDGDFFVDVGANVGHYAVPVASMVGDTGQIIAFEPEIEARTLLERNIALNKLAARIRVEPFAVCDSQGTRAFYSRHDDSMSSLHREGFGTNSGMADISETLVKTVSLDDYLASHGLRDPDWLKIDAEGAEIQVLRGARRALQGRTNIVCELHPYAWEAFDSTFDELVSLVQGANRKMRFLEDSRDIANGPDYGTILIEA
jgi:methyltransferase, FkbM family